MTSYRQAAQAFKRGRRGSADGNPGGVDAGQSTCTATTPVNTGDLSTVTVTAKGPGGSPLAGQTVTFSVSGTNNTLHQPTATTDASGVATGTFSSTTAETKTVTATAGGIVITQQPAVVVQANGAVWRGNEPAGYTKVTDHPFNTLTNSDQSEAFLWTDNLGMSIVTDATAPQSPSNVIQEQYPAGFSGGSASGSIEYDHIQDMVAGATKLYLAMWYKLSANFQGQSTATNKLFLLWYANVPAIFISNEGVGAGTLTVTPRIQHNSLDARDNLPQNVGSAGDATCVRGQWNLLELVLLMNTPGTKNGTWQQWLNGKMTHNYTDVGFAATGDPHVWQFIGLDPIWGGLGDTVTNTMDIWWDELYCSAST